MEEGGEKKTFLVADPVNVATSSAAADAAAAVEIVSSSGVAIP